MRLYVSTSEGTTTNIGEPAFRRCPGCPLAWMDDEPDIYEDDEPEAQE